MTTARFALSISLLAATLLYLDFFTSKQVVPIHRRLEDLPAAIGGWHGVRDTALDDDMLDLLRPTDYLIRRYDDADGRTLWLYVGYWESQRRGAQIHSPKNCLPGGGWEPLEATRREIPVPGTVKALDVNYYLLQKDSERQIVLYWFESQGRPVTSEIRAKIELVRGSVLHNRTDGAIIRVSSVATGSLEETSVRLVKYVQAMYPILEGFLPP